MKHKLRFFFSLVFYYWYIDFPFLSYFFFPKIIYTEKGAAFLVFFNCQFHTLHELCVSFTVSNTRIQFITLSVFLSCAPALVSVWHL